MRLKDKIHWIEYYMRMTGGREIEEDEWDDVGAFALEHDCPEPSVPTKTPCSRQAVRSRSRAVVRTKQRWPSPA